MSHPRHADLEALLDALIRARVEFIVVGGAAAVLHGAPITTHDLDIVHRRTEENVARLHQLLSSLDARLRDPAGRHLVADEAMLRGTGQMNLSTSLGPLDPICLLHDGRGYDELLGHSIVLTDDTLEIRVLDLATLIEIKQTTGRAKDRLMVPVLLALANDGRE